MQGLFPITVNRQDLMLSRAHESELELARLGCAHIAGHRTPTTGPVPATAVFGSHPEIAAPCRLFGPPGTGGADIQHARERDLFLR
ncbi:MAG: hypothetical protein FJ222_11560 [Lentisphaerae bacterium]|nr:hypothetical protein [Lentisphaerota bacterium]